MPEVIKSKFNSEYILKIAEKYRQKYRAGERETKIIVEMLEELNTVKAKINTCRWCGEFVDDDDFCSPECLEQYAKEYIKKNKK